MTDQVDMTSESHLDISYTLNPRIVSSIRSADSVAVLGAGAPLELPLGLFQVLMAFAEKQTVRQAFARLEVDIDLEEFGGVIGDFFERGLLKREQASEHDYDLRRLLAARLFSDAARSGQIAGWMRQGRAIIIPDALPQDFAEDVHRDLSRSTQWAVSEGGHDFFHYRSCILDQLEDRTPALAECARFFKSTATRRFIGEISGQDCSGQAHAAAAWYRPNEYALPHDDSTARDPRSVAYIWYLAKDWQQEWGGSLFWCPTGQYVSPGFNVLVMFQVTPANMHFVCPVAPTATSKRLTINGFWSRSVRDAAWEPVAPGAFLSPRAYGPPAPDQPELAPIMVI